MLANHDIAIKTAHILLEINAVSFRFNPPFVYTTGIKSPIYLDNRIVMSHPKQRRIIVDYYIEIIKEKIGLSNVDYISGTASAAIPQASWVAGILNLPMVYVRPTTKSYGKGNKLEGYFKKGSNAVVVEDHVSTATSVVNNAETVRGMEGNVSFCVATTTYNTKESNELLKKHNITLFTLTDGKTIVEQAVKTGVLKGDEKAKVDLWFEDPSSWAKKMNLE